MRIAYISYEYPSAICKGGIGTYIFNISQLLNKQKHEVAIFCGSQIQKTIEINENISIYYINCSNPVDFREKVLNVFKEENLKKKFDLVESPEVNANGILIQKNFSEIPFVTRLHTPNAIILKYRQVYSPIYEKLRYVIGSLRRGKFDLGYWRRKAFDKNNDIEYQIAAGAWSVSVPSVALKQWAVGYWELPSEKITVIPNPVSFNNDLLLLPPNPYSRVILYLGRLDIIKGVINLTKALKKVLKKYPDWKMHFAGADAPSHKKSLSIREYILNELEFYKTQLIFTDSYSLNELPSILKNASICVLPSYFESFSYTCAEAMAAGKAIIGSKCGGMRDLLDNGKAGILINPHSTKDIEIALINLMSDRNKMLSLGILSRNRLMEIYNNEIVVDQIIDYYNKIIREFHSQ